MLEAARNARHVLLGTATPIQTDVAELWDALEILNQSADHVLGRMFGPWRQCRSILPVVTGEKPVEEEHEAWQLIRNPLPPRREETLFDYIRTDLGIADGVFFTDRPILDYRATLTADRDLIRRFNQELVRRGVVKAVNKIYVSLAHTEADVDETIGVFDEVLATLAR